MQREGISTIGIFLRNKWVWLFMGLGLIAIVIVVVLRVNNANKTAVLNFVVAPIDASITINGKSGYSSEGGPYYFEPGGYKIEISRETFDQKVIDVNLEANYNTTVAVFLSQNGNFEFYNNNENLNSYYVLANIASAGNNQTIDKDNSAESFIENMQRNIKLFSDYLPIMDQTPTGNGLNVGVNYQYDTLKIEDGSYLDDCEKILCLYITDTSGKKEQFAMDVIKKFGFNVDLCQIIYKRVDYE